MSRKHPGTRLNSKIFGVAIDDYKKRNCAPGAKNYEVYSALAKVLPEHVEVDTIRLWRYRRNPAIGANLEKVNQFLGVDCSFQVAEERNDSVLTNKPLTVEGQLALEIYRHLFTFLDSVTFDSCLDEIEGNFYELEREIESRRVFLSPALMNLIETAFDEIVLPFLDEDVFLAEYTHEIGHQAPDGFHVDNLPLLVRVHEEIMAPYKSRLAKFGQDILKII